MGGDQRQILHHLPLKIRVEFLARVDIALGGRGGQQLVDPGTAVRLGVGPDHPGLDVARQVGAVNANHRVAVIESAVHRRIEVLRRHAPRPGRKVGRGTNADLDADLLELRPQVFGDRLRVVGRVGQKVDHHAEALARCVRLVARSVEHRIGLLQVELVGLDLVGIERRTRRNRAGGHARDALVQLFDDEVLVDRMGDGLTNPDVVERLALHVERQPAKRADGIAALARDHHILGLGQLRKLRQRDRTRQPVDLAALERNRLRRGVGDDAKNQSIELRPVFQEKAGVALHHDRLARLELDHLERPRAHRQVVLRMGLDVLAIAKHMLGDDRAKRW